MTKVASQHSFQILMEPVLGKNKIDSPAGRFGA